MNFENVQNKRRLRLEPECHGYFQRKIAEFSEYFWSVNLSDSQVTIYISELSISSKFTDQKTSKTLAIFSYDFLLNVSTEIRPLIVETQKMYYVRKNILKSALSACVLKFSRSFFKN